MEMVVNKGSLNQLYPLYEKLIYSTCWRFKKRFGGEFDELVGEANLIYVNEVKRYYETTMDSNKGELPLSSWLAQKIWFGLTNKRNRHENKWANMVEHDEEKHPTHESAARHFGFVDLMDELSSDAKHMVNMLLDSPPHLKALIEDNNDSMRTIKYTLTKYLKTRGWGVTRIKHTFREIAKVVNSGD